jgi:hypothetical protein
MVSSRITLQLLLALGTAVAAPAYYEKEGIHNARELSSLDYPQERSITPDHQEYSRGYGDTTLLSIRADTPSPPSMSATNADKLKWNEDRIPNAQTSVTNAQQRVNTVNADPNATPRARSAARNNLHTAQESLSTYRENVEHYKSEIAKGHP